MSDERCIHDDKLTDCRYDGCIIEVLRAELERKDEALRRVGCQSPKCEAKYETCFICAALTPTPGNGESE